MAEATKPGPYARFMGRWGWPIMGLLAAAPVVAHALDWRRRVEAKKKLQDERLLHARKQVAELEAAIPSAESVYKAASCARTLASMADRPAVEKLDLLDKAIRARK